MSSVLRTVVGVVRSVAAWLWAALALPPLTLVSLVALPFDPHQRMHDLSSTLWMKGILWLSGIRVVVQGAEHVRREHHYIVACNHQSLVDILAVLSTLQPLTPVRFMAKRSLFYVPVFGLAMRAFGHVPVDRARGRGLLREIKLAKERVQKGVSYVFFPEGTRSLDGAMQPFKRGAFWIALRTGTSILPITVTGAVEAFPKGQYFIYGGPVVTLRVHSPLPTAGLGESPEAVDALAARTWDVIAAGLPEPLRVRSRRTPGQPPAGGTGAADGSTLEGAGPPAGVGGGTGRGTAAA
ncbi:MAG TPA: lysophospholipid acyltransferase family protein [Myxococcota bacterium]|jgi:1-acyl-sn-glycerol-3-phosphate acyltransferase|nr:lysophospholipid acyltransferase family protein [Myxococcota bacterium]